MKSIQLTFFHENDEKVLTIDANHIANLKLFGIAESMRLKNDEYCYGRVADSYTIEIKNLKDTNYYELGINDEYQLEQIDLLDDDELVESLSVRINRPYRHIVEDTIDRLLLAQS